MGAATIRPPRIRAALDRPTPRRDQGDPPVPPQNLRIPGPRPCPTPVREAGRGRWSTTAVRSSRRSSAACSRDLRPAFGTAKDVLILTASGHGRPRGGGRQRPLPGRPRAGRQHRHLRRPLRDHRHDLRRGRHPPRRRVGPGGGPGGRPCAPIAGHGCAEGRSPAAVLLTFNETSTGVTNPLAELAAAVRAEAPDALILVDAHQRPSARCPSRWTPGASTSSSPARRRPG